MSNAQSAYTASSIALRRRCQRCSTIFCSLQMTGKMSALRLLDMTAAFDTRWPQFAAARARATRQFGLRGIGLTRSDRRPIYRADISSRVRWLYIFYRPPRVLSTILGLVLGPLLFILYTADAVGRVGACVDDTRFHAALSS